MNDSIYRSHVRPDREYLGFSALPLLETRVERQRREAARVRAVWFTAGVAVTFFAILGIAIAI